MNSINASNNVSYLIPTEYKIDNPDFTNLKSAKKADIPNKELLNNNSQNYLGDTDSTSSMFSDLFLFHYNLNVASPISYNDGTKDIDSFVGIVKKHKEYIHKNI